MDEQPEVALIRDILIVRIQGNGETVLQPFYRSSGTDSNLPGVWFPFDGVAQGGEMQDYGKWFKKTRFTNPKVPEFIDSGNTRTANRITRMDGTRLIQEYGPMYLKISEMLNRARIVPEKIVTYEEINEALNL